MKKERANSLNVMLVGFCPVIREGLKKFLTQDPKIKLTENILDGQQALLRIRQSHREGSPINVVLTETRTSTYDGVAVIKLIKDAYPEIAILALTENSNDSYIIDAIHAGASGYIFLKDMTQETLTESIWSVLEGGTQINVKLLKAAIDDLLKNGRKSQAERTTEGAHLTEREVEVLRLLGNGFSNKQIAESLSITLDTTKKHIRNVIDKLQVHGRTHAALIAAQSGLVSTKPNPFG
ncbi:MAG: response regulator transcription factor [Dehalococcoidales bacterium]|nr:response regulator transcription factor [Dehalococcoidales bacterium]